MSQLANAGMGLFGGSGVVKTQSAKSCPNFHFGGGSVFLTKYQYSGVVKIQSAKICLNFNGEGGILE